jgi:pimeloyl-ACP methyl ester carboxylesterase
LFLRAEMAQGDIDLPGHDEMVTVPGGPNVLLRHYGDPQGTPLLMLHGTPGSRFKFSMTHGIAKDLALHVIAPDRWAYGGTAAPTKPTLTEFARWISDAMSSMGHRTFAVSGISGGGPYAAAVAAHCPDRVTALALISPVGLVADATAAGEVDLFHRFCFRTLADSPCTVAAIFGAYEATVRHTPALAARLTVMRAPAPDQAIMNDPKTRKRLLRTFAEGLRTSARGPAIDLALFREIAQVDLSRATMPAHVWIGTRDMNVPVMAAKRLAAKLPNAKLTVMQGEGHLWAALHYDVILHWIATAIGPTRAKP